MRLFIFFFNDPATTEIYTLSLHDARSDLCVREDVSGADRIRATHVIIDHRHGEGCVDGRRVADRKSTRLNSSHVAISYAVFCLKKKTTTSNQLYINYYATDYLHDDTHQHY